MRIPRCARGNAESERMVFRQAEIIRKPFIYKSERARRISVPGVRRYYIQSRSQLRLKDLLRFGLVSWRGHGRHLTPRKSTRVTIGSFKRKAPATPPHLCGGLRGHTVRVPRWLSSNFGKLRRSTVSLPRGATPIFVKVQSTAISRKPSLKTEARSPQASSGSVPIGPTAGS